MYCIGGISGKKDKMVNIKIALGVVKSYLGLTFTETSGSFRRANQLEGKGKVPRLITEKSRQYKQTKKIFDAQSSCNRAFYMHLKYEDFFIMIVLSKKEHH